MIKGLDMTMTNRLRIILTFITVMSVIFHGRLFLQWYVPLAYIQVCTTLAALVFVVWRSYLWIDFGTAHKWHYNIPPNNKFGFEKQIHINYTGWAVFVSTLIFMSIALLCRTWQDFVWFTHVPLVFLSIELYIPYKHLIEYSDWLAIQEARKPLPADPSSAQYQANPVLYQQAELERRSSFRLFGKK